KVKELKEREARYGQMLERYLQLKRDLADLTRLDVVVSTLAWSEGYPVDGSSPLTRYLNDRPFRTALWFQPAGQTRDQVWSGLFRDADFNGVMEFAPPGTRVRPQRWTPEMNFIGWQPYQGDRQPALPEKATLRVAVQWREAHDAEFLRAGEDLYA